MDAIILSSEQYNKLLKILETIDKKLAGPKQCDNEGERWLDNEDVCRMLHISKRTLQNYRDNGTLSFSQIGGKIYYKASDIERHLNKHYRKSILNS